MKKEIAQEHHSFCMVFQCHGEAADCFLKVAQTMDFSEC